MHDYICVTILYTISIHLFPCMHLRKERREERKKKRQDGEREREREGGREREGEGEGEKETERCFDNNFLLRLITDHEQNSTETKMHLLLISSDQYIVNPLYL